MQTVGDIGIRCAGIEIEEKQRQMRVEVLVTAFDTFADDMVRNAAERLQRDHFVDAMIRQVAYLAWQEPSLAEVCGGVDDAAALVPDIHDICERSVERVVAAETVIDMCIVEQKAVDEFCLPGAQTVLADVLLAVDEGVRNGRGEETRDRRRHYFHAVLHFPYKSCIFIRNKTKNYFMPSPFEYLSGLFFVKMQIFLAYIKKKQYFCSRFRWKA